MKRSPLKRGDYQLKRTAIKAVSLKKSERDRRFAKTAQVVFERDDYCCRARKLVPGVECWHGLHPHHIRQTSLGGTDAPSNLMTVCPRHHSWIHDNEQEAIKLGLLDGVLREAS